MKYLLYILPLLCFSCKEQKATLHYVVPSYESFSFPKELEDEIIDIDLSYYGMMCECPQWATPENTKLFNAKRGSDDMIDYDSLFVEIRPAHDSISYPFDLPEVKMSEELITDFTFKGSFYKGKHHWQSEGGDRHNNRVFKFTSCKIKKSNLL